MSHHSVLSNLTSNKKNSKQKTRKKIDVHKNNRLIKFIRQTAEKHKFLYKYFGKNKIKTKIKKKTLIDLLT